MLKDSKQAEKAQTKRKAKTEDQQTNQPKRNKSKQTREATHQPPPTKQNKKLSQQGQRELNKVYQHLIGNSTKHNKCANRRVKARQANYKLRNVIARRDCLHMRAAQ